MGEYREKLKDPRWQKMRLKIFERDKWTCRNCEDKETSLHIHHIFYESDKDPWDYPENSLITLCKDCHQEEAESYKEAMQNLKGLFDFNGYLARDIWDLGDVLHEMIGLDIWILRRIFCQKPFRKERAEIFKAFQNAIESFEKRKNGSKSND